MPEADAAPPRRDPLARILESAPVELRWAAGLLQASGDPAHRARVADMLRRVEDAEGAMARPEPPSPAEKKALLAPLIAELHYAGEALRRTDDRVQRHRANGILQTAINGEYLMSRP